MQGLRNRTGKRRVVTGGWGGCRKRVDANSIKIRYIHKYTVEARINILSSFLCKVNRDIMYPIYEDSKSDD